MNIDQASTGKRRYGLGERTAPTRGQVNPQGYIQRELRNRQVGTPAHKPVLSSGMPSQRRSGLAQAALRNIPKFAKPAMAPTSWGGRGLGRPISNGPKPPVQGPRPALVKRPKHGGAPVRGASPVAPAMPAGTGTPLPQPSININANGTLDLPFDESAALGLLEQQQSANADLMELQRQEQEQQLEYAKTKREAELGFKEQQRNTLNSNAAAGTAFSSSYGVQATDDSKEYNNYMNDLNSANTGALDWIRQSRGNIQNALSDYIRQSTASQGMGLAGEAGTLGYSTSAPKNVKSKSKPVPKNNNNDKPKNKDKPKNDHKEAANKAVGNHFKKLKKK